MEIAVSSLLIFFDNKLSDSLFMFLLLYMMPEVTRDQVMFLFVFRNHIYL